MIHFHTALSEACAKHAINQSELARRAGVTRQMISSLFSVGTRPRAKVFARILRAFGDDDTALTIFRAHCLDEAVRCGIPPEKVLKKPAN